MPYGKFRVAGVPVFLVFVLDCEPRPIASRLSEEFMARTLKQFPLCQPLQEFVIKPAVVVHHVEVVSEATICCQRTAGQRHPASIRFTWLSIHVRCALRAPSYDWMALCFWFRSFCFAPFKA